MKTEKYIFEKVASMENITAALYRAAENKKARPEVQRVLAEPEKHVHAIYKMFWTKTFIPCVPRVSKTKEGAGQKERLITKIDFFPDQIIHWAIILQLQPIIIRGAYDHSCGCMPGKGVHYGNKQIEKWIRKDKKNTKYCAKLDIRKYYESIGHPFVKRLVRTKIKDDKMLWLLDAIVDSYSPGLPIGFLTSQWLGNFILQRLDYLIKQDQEVLYYLRYMDDLVLFGRNKKKLHKTIRAIMDFVSRDGFEIKHTWQVFKVDARAVDVMGFRFFRNKTILRKSLMLRITRKARSIWRKGYATPGDAAAILSYMGWVRHSDTKRMCKVWVKSIISIKRLKQIVRMFSKKEVGKNERCTVRKRRQTAIA